MKNNLNIRIKKKYRKATWPKIVKIYRSEIKRIQNVSLGEETDCSMNYSSERMKIHATWNRNKSPPLSSLYTVTHNAVYERERERERGIANNGA